MTRYLEDKLQMACKYWFDCQYPALAPLLHHSPNEGKLVMKSRDGAKRRAMGMRAGFPDFIFLQPSRNYPYLAIELKSEKGRQTEAQKAYQQAVENAGGKYAIVRSIEDFMKLINKYLDQKV